MQIIKGIPKGIGGNGLEFQSWSGNTVIRKDMRPLCSSHRCPLAITFLLLFFMCSCASVEKQPAAGACRDNPGSGIRNFCVVTPHVLWRGARPDKDGTAGLIQHGVRTVVNLELILDDKLAWTREL